MFIKHKSLQLLLECVCYVVSIAKENSVIRLLWLLGYENEVQSGVQRARKDIHATDDVGDGFSNAVITGCGVALAAFIEQLHKLSGKPASQAVQLTDPTVVVFLRYDLQPLHINITVDENCRCVQLSSRVVE